MVQGQEPTPPPNWASGSSSLGRPARQPRLVTSPSKVPSTVFNVVQPGPAPYGYAACEKEAHDWRVFASKPEKVLVGCKICKTIGDILETPHRQGDAEVKWAQLQKAMSARDNKAA